MFIEKQIKNEENYTSNKEKNFKLINNFLYYKKYYMYIYEKNYKIGKWNFIIET